jgi:hypothetical protein
MAQAVERRPAARLTGRRSATAFADLPPPLRSSSDHRPESTSAGFVVRMKSVSARTKRSGSSRCGKVAGVGEDLELASRDLPMGRARVLDRDDRVALAPHDQERDRLGEIETVARVDPLTPGIDDRPERVQERRPGFAVRERRMPAQGLTHVGVHSQPHVAEEASQRPARAEERPVDEQREHELGARKRGRPQQHTDLATEAAAAHEHEPVAVLGELVRQLHRHAAAQ